MIYDDERCTCTMEFQSTANSNHDDHCELWLCPSFIDESDEWDGSLGILVLARRRRPWNNAEDYVWNGDTPVVSQSTALARIEAQRAAFEDFTTPAVEILGDLETEAMNALVEHGDDEYGFIALPDGSYIDMTNRVTYRILVDPKGGKTWGEELWDDPLCATAAVPMCVCVPLKRFYCNTCNVQRATEADEWTVWAPYNPSTTSTGYSSYSTTPGCKHTFETFLLPKGQHENIKISGARTHTPTTMPDHGLYASNCWSPQCVATFIPWTDYGLPTCDYRHAVEAIVSLWDMACAGKVVEVGCMGGHGRTGTILACLATLSDPSLTAEEAVAWTRDVHCTKAVETNQQEWFVAKFMSMVRGTVAPPMPEKYYTPTIDSWKSSTDNVKSAAESARSFINSPKGQTMLAGYPVSPAGGKSTDSEVDAALLAFQPLEKKPQGPTANARRRNARRANRRAANKRAASLAAALRNGYSDEMEDA